MLFHHPFEKHLRVVTNDVWLTFPVEGHYGLRVGLFDLVRGEENALAEEVCQKVVRADELHTPIKSVEDVSFHSDELFVGEGHTDVLKQLLDAWISHLVVLGRDKDACGRDQGHNVAFGLPAEVRNSLEVLADIRDLHVRVKSRHTVVESLVLVLELAAQVAHPVDVEFACADTLDEVLAESILGVAVPVGLLNGSLILEGTAGGAITEVTVLLVPQEEGHAACALCALDGERGAVCRLSANFLFSSERRVD